MQVAFPLGTTAATPPHERRRKRNRLDITYPARAGPALHRRVRGGAAGAPFRRLHCSNSPPRAARACSIWTRAKSCAWWTAGGQKLPRTLAGRVPGSAPGLSKPRLRQEPAVTGLDARHKTADGAYRRGRALHPARRFQRPASATTTATPDWTATPNLIQRDLFILPNNVLREPFSIRWVGKVAAPTTGRYVFGTRSDDGSLVYVDGQLVVDNSGSHGAEYREGVIDLTEASTTSRCGTTNWAARARCNCGGSLPPAARASSPAPTCIRSKRSCPWAWNCPRPRLFAPPGARARSRGDGCRARRASGRHRAASAPRRFPRGQPAVLWTYGACGSGDEQLQKPIGVAVPMTAGRYLSPTWATVASCAWIPDGEFATPGAKRAKAPASSPSSSIWSSRPTARSPRSMPSTRSSPCGRLTAISSAPVRRRTDHLPPARIRRLPPRRLFHRRHRRRARALRRPGRRPGSTSSAAPTRILVPASPPTPPLARPASCM